jgi:HEAT repeat protein
MGKALRTMAMYPPQHPARDNLLAQAFTALHLSLREVGDLTFQVVRDGFLFQDVKIGEKQSLISDLAKEMHLRQVKSFSLRPELSGEDFQAFLELLMEGPENFRKGRFIEQWFRARRIQSIWINEMDFSRIMTLTGAEEDRPPSAGEITLETQLEETLQRLVRETDPERFSQLLREVEVLARPCFESKDYQTLWGVISAVSEQADPERRPGPANEPIRAHALRTLRAMTRDDFLLHLLERYNKQGQDREALYQVFQQLGPAVIDAVITVTSQRESIAVYRPLLDLALAFGQEGRAVLENYFLDDNPLKVRRALLVVGELRSRHSVEAVRKLVEHKDLKVRREAVKALAQIRGLEASRALLAALHAERDLDLKAAIVAALGESKDLAAVPTLIKLLKGLPLREDTVALREAVIESLGRIGSLEAVPILVKALNKFSLFHRELALRARVKAALALGRLGGESAMQALARYARPGDDPLRRASAAVLKALLENNGRPVEISEEELKQWSSPEKNSKAC